jgi:uncharacterized membrane protein
MLPVGTIILVIVAILVFFGVLHRVLDRMRMSDRAALAVIIAMAVGTFIEFTLAKAPVLVTMNVGGFLVPLAVVVWLVATADEPGEKAHSITAAVISGIVVWGLSKILNPEEQMMMISPMIVFGLAAGIVAALSGRSRRAAFVGGIGGLILSDIFHWIELMIKGIPGAVQFGGAGTFDAIVIAGIIAVGLVEIVGETREHLVKPPKERRGSNGS